MMQQEEFVTLPYHNSYCEFRKWNFVDQVDKLLSFYFLCISLRLCALVFPSIGSAWASLWSTDEIWFYKWWVFSLWEIISLFLIFIFILFIYLFIRKLLIVLHQGNSRSSSKHLCFGRFLETSRHYNGFIYYFWGNIRYNTYRMFWKAKPGIYFCSSSK